MPPARWAKVIATAYDPSVQRVIDKQDRGEPLTVEDRRALVEADNMIRSEVRRWQDGEPDILEDIDAAVQPPDVPAPPMDIGPPVGVPPDLGPPGRPEDDPGESVLRPSDTSASAPAPTAPPDSTPPEYDDLGLPIPRNTSRAELAAQTPPPSPPSSPPEYDDLGLPIPRGTTRSDLEQQAPPGARPAVLPPITAAKPPDLRNSSDMDLPRSAVPPTKPPAPVATAPTAPVAPKAPPAATAPPPVAPKAPPAATKPPPDIGPPARPIRPPLFTDANPNDPLIDQGPFRSAIERAGGRPTQAIASRTARQIGDINRSGFQGQNEGWATDAQQAATAWEEQYHRAPQKLDPAERRAYEKNPNSLRDTILDDDSPFKNYRESWIGAYRKGELVPLAQEYDASLRGQEGYTSPFDDTGSPPPPPPTVDSTSPPPDIGPPVRDDWMTPGGMDRGRGTGIDSPPIGDDWMTPGGMDRGSGTGIDSPPMRDDWMSPLAEEPPPEPEPDYSDNGDYTEPDYSDEEDLSNDEGTE
jgi:hypothetical protein